MCDPPAPSVLYNIMANEFVSEDYKDRLRVAARSGRDSNTCLVSMSSVTCYSSLFTCIMSPVTCYLSPVTCHLPGEHV